MKITVRFLLALQVCALALSFASPVSAASQPVESFKLANGLEVIVLPNHRIPAVSQMVWYRIGSADDPLGKSGLAHFHEHVMFLGTDKHKAGEYSEIISRNGGQENAFTGYDATSYYINIAKEQLPLAMELEADRMRPLRASDEAVAREKQVIIEERRMRIENNPSALLDEQVNAALFRNHPYHIPVIGWMHEMEGLTKADVMKFHQTWYHPNNAILILSGDITAAEARPLVQKYYGGLQAGNVPARRWNKEPPQNTERRIVMHHKNVKQPEWRRSYMAPSIVDGNKEQCLPLFVLAGVMGEGKSSRLYKSLVVEQKLATGVDVDYNGFTVGPAQFELAIVPEQGVDMSTLEKAVDKEIERIVKDSFAEGDLSRARTQLKAESVYARDSLTSMARIMGWIRIASLDKYYFTRWPQMIDAVTGAQVLKAAQDTLQPNRSVTALLLPEEKTDTALISPPSKITVPKGGKS